MHRAMRSHTLVGLLGLGRTARPTAGERQNERQSAEDTCEFRRIPCPVPNMDISRGMEQEEARTRDRNAFSAWGPQVVAFLFSWTL